jgi:dethiobiotin synthetase
MLRRFFVTGTDARAGKTIVSRALLQALSSQDKIVVGYKPIVAGCQTLPNGLYNKDAQVLANASSVAFPEEKITPIQLAQEEIYASELPDNIFQIMTEGLDAISENADTVVIEGCDGWRSLITPNLCFSQWVRQQQLPVILVVGIQAGCVNHALLTVEAILNDGLPLCGWVANRINPGLAHYAETIQAIQENISAPLLGEIPYLPRAETRDLAKYLDLSKIN